MKPIRCIAIDDEPLALEKFENHIRKIPFMELVALCETPFKAEKVMAEEPIDAIFVDINMPDLNGIDFIRTLPEPPMVVFTTAYSEYAVTGYRLDAIDYLLKPYDFTDFQRVANKLLKQYNLMNPETVVEENNILVKEGYKYVNVCIEDIMFVKGLSEYVQIFVKGRKPVIAYTTMKQINDRLPEHFLQVHRSYIVNMLAVKEIERARITIGDVMIPVSDGYKRAFTNYLHNHSLDRDKQALLGKES